jgi:hypothetical protein
MNFRLRILAPFLLNLLIDAGICLPGKEGEKRINLYAISILTSHKLYGSLISGASSVTAHIQLGCTHTGRQREKARPIMTNLDWFMEFLVAGVFVLLGIRKVMTFRRKPRALGARHSRLPFGLPHGSIAVVGLLEILAALALVAPAGPFPPATLALIAAAALALLTTAAGIYHVHRRESAVPSVALFLLALFVIVGRTV